MTNNDFRKPIPTASEFQLKPLVACMRVAIVGSMLAGGIDAARAELPVPIQGNWVSSGSATQQVLGNTLKIEQKSDKAILNWQSFNVGKDKKVQFVQPGSSSIALNRIHQQDPSKIFGKIVANGQVYLYNKNGFVFGKDSVVNTNSLIATTLNISDEVFERGITRVFDDNGKAALEIEPMQPGDMLDPKTAKILIEAGAKIHTDKAGRIIIAAPTIENHGSVSSEAQGQVIMTASQDKVYLQAADKDSPFAGLLVEVDTGGKVTNAGEIMAKQGNVTLAGFAVNQHGRINATTSVNVNGSIRLLAKEKVDLNSKKLLSTKTERDTELDDGLGQSAKVTLAQGSVTQVVADTNGGSAIDEQQQPDSLLEITAKQVELQAGSKIRVPGGKVKVTATDNLLDPTAGSKGRLFIDKQASIDVSGYKNVTVDMERNVGEVSAQSYELRDAPLQRNGVLRGANVQVDLRKDSKIVDASGAKARITRDIKERLAEGGQIDLTASGDMIANDGASLDISGGSVKYRDGYINTSKLFTEYGSFVDINDADPNQKFTGLTGKVVESHDKWGVKKVWKIMDVFGQGNFEKGYVEGKNAGSINIVTPRLAWGGNIKAGAPSGPYQRAQSDQPFGGRFNIDMAVFQSLQGVEIQRGGSTINLTADQAFPETEAGKATDLVVLSDVINASNLGEFSVKTWGKANVADNANVLMKPNAKLAIQAGSISFDGRFKAAGGAISLNATVQGEAGEGDSSQAGQLQLGSDAVLDVSGVWVNDLHPDAGGSPLDALAVKGGQVSLSTEGDLLVDKGSVIRADGGAWLPVTGKLQAGKGGSITLAAKGDGSQSSLLTLKGQLSAYGLEQNGTLTLESGRIVVGKPGQDEDVSQTLVLDISNGNFDFSQQLTFSEINLRAGFSDLNIKSDVNLDLRQKNWELPENYLQVASGAALRSFSKIVELAEHLRQPTGLNLAAVSGVKQEQGSRIRVDKGGAINLSTQAGNIVVDGVLQAPGGSIGLTIQPSNGLEYDPTQAIWLGQHAQLLAQGASRFQPKDVFGYRQGEVLDGGQIVFDAQRGMIVSEAGSLLDVSGTQAKLHILKDNNSQAPQYQQKNIASNAGSISMTAAEGIILNGKMRAIAGSSTTHGGKLAMTLDRSKRNPPEEPKVPFPSHPLMLNITQTARRSLEDDFVQGDVFPDAVNGQATLVADQVDAGGFTRLDLASKDQVVFFGDVKLSAAERIHIDAPVIRGVEDGTIELETAFLQIGSSFNRNIADSAELGGAKFTAHANWIQLQGATQWHGFGQLSLNSEHDLRTLGLRNEDEQRDYVGALVTAADLFLHASQIYPTTLTDFSFLVKNNPEGRIVISGSNSDKSPLSAAGSLTFEAAQIIQQGVLKAPFGTITLKAANSLTLAEGSLTSVSAAGSSIPFGVTQGGLDWLYPLDTLNNLVFKAAPEKRLVLSAAEIDVAKGSVVDVSGGGNLLSYEFQPGAGGSYDYLQPGSPAYQGGFAILPSLGSKLAPYDHFENQSWDFQPGSSVYLSGVAGLPAGEYSILPAHYALLKGAYLVTPVADTQDLSVTQKTLDGRSIISGYFMQADSKIRDARSTGFLIENGADVRLRAEYDVQNANDFYQNQAKQRDTAVPVLPMDGGQISLIAQTKLIMEGDFMMDALGDGKGAKMDIAANRIVVSDQFSETPTEGTLEILANDLSALNVESLLLGGARTRDNQSGETAIQVSSQQVVFSGNTQLKGAEILAVATDLVEVQDGVSIESDRLADTGDSVLNVVGDGALLRVSGAEQVELNRTETSGTTGVLRLAAGSSLKASGSMLLDGSLSTELQGDLAMQGGSLNLAASSINIGEVDQLGGAALNLSNQKLANLAVDELVLTARDSVGVYGTVGQVDAEGNFLLDTEGQTKALEFERLLINSAGLTGHGSAEQQARLNAGTLGLSNSAATTNQQLVDGQGQLELHVENLEVGDGAFALQGFSTVKINAADQIRAVGQGTLKVGGKLQAATAAFTADGGAKLKIDASGYQADFAHLSSQAVAQSGYAGAVAVVADVINFNTQVTLPSGLLDIQALSGDLSLGEQAKLDLAGRAVQFADQKQYMPGGSLKAVAVHGKLSFAAGSSIDLDSAGGDAPGGNLILQAPDKTLELSGQLQNAQGSVLVDVSEFAGNDNFDALMQKFATAGINQSIYFRTRQADIQQGAASTITAQEVSLVSDAGAIDLAGRINADAKDAGGSIKLFAGDRIVLKGAQLSAQGKNAGAKGGRVLLSSVDNDEDANSGIGIEANSLVDVSGNNAEGGVVTLRALRTADGVNIQPIAGQIRGHKALYAEAVKKYGNADLGNDGRIDSADIDKIQTETAAYMTAARMLNVTETLGQGIRLLPGVEINVSGDLVLQDKWDLLAWRYDEDSDSNVWDDLPGHLTIRTDGHFTLQQSLSDGFKNENFEYVDEQGVKKTVSIVDNLQNGASWSYQLVAGSDLHSADPGIAVAQKNLTVGSNVRVRTGTGNIQLNAGGDIVIAAGEVIDNKVGGSSGTSAAKDSITLPIADIEKWKVGGYLSGNGIAPGTFIVAIDTSQTSYKTSAAIIRGSLSLQVGQDISGWKVGDYLSGNGIDRGVVITRVNPNGISNILAAGVVADSQSLQLVDTSGWVVGDVISGEGFAADTVITSIDTVGLTKTSTARAIENSQSLRLSNTTGLVVGDYLTGAGLAEGTAIIRINSAGVTKTSSAQAIKSGFALRVANASGWVVGDYLTGTGLANNTVITRINSTGVEKTSAAQAIKNSLSLQVADTSGWVVGDYLTGTGLANNTVISRINDSGITQSVSAAVANNSTTLKVKDLTGWVVGDYLSGSGIANNTVITAINTSTKTVTLSNKVTAAIAIDSQLSTLPAIHLSAATTAQVNASASIISLPSIHLSEATTAQVNANASIKSQPSIHLNKAVETQVNAAVSIKSLPSVRISKAVNSEMTMNTGVSTLPSVHLSKPVTVAIAKNANISSMPYVTLSSPLALAATANSKITATYTPGSIYSAGTNSVSLPYGSLSNRAVALFFNSQYPVNGGDVSLTATGNIQGTVSGNDFNDWLLRIGEWSETNPVQPTAWGVGLGYIPGSKSNIQPGRSALPLFQQNLAAFGGGKVAVKAGGNINDLEVVMPTTGKQIGDANGSFNLNGFLSNQVQIQGGGSMQIVAGGNISGGSYYLGQGEASLNAGGSIQGGSQYLQGPALLMGDTRFSVHAGKSVSLSGVIDPMIAHRGDVNFFSYTENSGLNLTSLSGDVYLRASGTLFVDSARSSQQSLAAIYPGSLQATAFGGNIISTSEVRLFPAARGDLSLYAQQDIFALTIGNRIGMSDADTTLLPTPEEPLANSDMSTVVGRLDPFGLPALNHAKSPMHSDDDQPARLVTRQGDITNIEFSIAKRALIKSGHDIVNLSLLLQHVNADDITLLEAGRDISYTSERNVKTGALLDNTAKIQIGGPGNVLIKSGRNTDLGASEGISTVGNVINTNLASTGAKLTLMVGLNGTAPDYLDFMSKYQPGSATLQSVIEVVEGMQDLANKSGMLVTLKNLQGMNAEVRSNYLIDLGGELRGMIAQPKQVLLEQLAAKNLLKLGSPDNKELSKQISEIKRQIDILETLDLQVDLLENGNKLIGEFMRNYTGNADLTHAEAKSLFKSLKQEAYLPIQSKLDLLATPVLFKEIKHAGSASALDKSAGNSSGYAAIESLFPGKEWQGNLSMFFSKIHTVDGGDIDLVVPGGEINTGLAVSFTGAKPASELGIVAQRQGSINAMVNDDFLVNTSRVFSLDGSDILIWSSEGDVDAGRGAKSAIAAPPPIISFDDNGNMVIEFPPIVSGSGIRTAASSEGVTPGDVYLFAPKGVVDAGEAGIGGSNVTISATAVLGANNIQVSGVGTGVPVASTGSMAAGLTGASNLSSGVSQMAESAVNNDVAKDSASKALAKAVLGILSVEILGFGE